MAAKGKVTDIAVPSIVFFNILVFVIWNYIPGSNEFMQRHFVVSREALRELRLWTLVTSSFAHHDLMHLILATVLLIVFGFLLEDLLGSKWFLEYYLVAGFIGAMNHCMLSGVIGYPADQVYGATPAMVGIMALGACVYGHRMAKAFGVLPIRPVWGLPLFLCTDIFGMLAPKVFVGVAMGHGAHIGAAIVSVLFYHYILRYRVWRGLRAVGEEDIVPIHIMGKQGWVIPCGNAEEYDNAKAFFGTTLGMKIKSEMGHGDAKKTIFSRSATFKMRSGNLEIVETSKTQTAVYRSPIPSLTVSNFAQALDTLDVKKYNFVSGLYKPRKRWAVTYFEGPNGQVYQLQGPYKDE